MPCQATLASFPGAALWLRIQALGTASCAAVLKSIDTASELDGATSSRTARGPSLSSRTACARTVLAACANAISTALKTTEPSLDQVAALKRSGVQARATVARFDSLFLSVPWRDVPTSWRECSTDAAILLVVASTSALFMMSLLSTESPGVSKRLMLSRDEVTALIRDLDKCLIVTAAPGEGRRGLVYALIDLLQDVYASAVSTLDKPVQPNASPRYHPATKRRRLGPRSEERGHVCGEPIRARLKVPELAEEPSLMAFLNGSCQRPFIVRDWARHWPALQPLPGLDGQDHGDGRWADRAYLSQLVGPRRVVPVEVGRSYTDAGWTQSFMPWGDFLERAGWHQEDPLPAAKQGPKEDGKQAEDQPTVYLAQHTLLTQFPQLEPDMVRPDLVYSCPGAPAWMPDYRPPQSDEQGGGDEVVVNAWIGPAGTISPAHTDPYYNLYVQVVGHKLVWLAPPGADAHGAMYQFGLDEPVGAAAKGSAAAMAYMDNTSQLDVFTSAPQDGQADPYPLFSEHVEPVAMQAVVGPGDLLYFPPKWWHAVKSLSRSISISHFF